MCLEPPKGTNKPRDAIAKGEDENGCQRNILREELQRQDTPDEIGDHAAPWEILRATIEVIEKPADNRHACMPNDERKQYAHSQNPKEEPARQPACVHTKH